MEIAVIRTFDNYFTANIALSKLQAHNIQCYLFDENTVTLGPILSTAIGYIKLVVDKNDEDSALNMLAQFDEEYMQTVICPKCKANNFLLVPSKGTKNTLTAMLTWLFSSYAVAPEQVYQCQECGFESKHLPEDLSMMN